MSNMTHLRAKQEVVNLNKREKNKEYVVEQTNIVVSLI